MSEQPSGAPPKPGGKKILGMPRNVVIIGGVALAAGIIFFLVKRKQSASATQDTTGTGTGEDFSGEISTLQSEFGNLASELAAMQGGGGSGGGGVTGGGGGTTGDGTTGADTSGGTGTTSGTGTTKTTPKPTAHKPVDGKAAHQKHVAHMKHLQHLKHRKHFKTPVGQRAGQPKR